MVRTQLPAYSPISFRDWARGAVSSLIRPVDVREGFRRHLAERFRAARVVLTRSGTQALELALRIGAGSFRAVDPVALPAYSCFDLATAAVGAGVQVRFYDLDPSTLSPDLESVREAVRGGARVVVA